MLSEFEMIEKSNEFGSDRLIFVTELSFETEGKNFPNSNTFRRTECFDPFKTSDTSMYVQMAIFRLCLRMENRDGIIAKRIKK